MLELWNLHISLHKYLVVGNQIRLLWNNGAESKDASLRRLRSRSEHMPAGRRVLACKPHRFTSQKLHHGAPCIYELAKHVIRNKKHFHEFCTHVQFLVCSLAKVVKEETVASFKQESRSAEKFHSLQWLTKWPELTMDSTLWKAFTFPNVKGGWWCSPIEYHHSTHMSGFVKNAGLKRWGVGL